MTDTEITDYKADAGQLRAIGFDYVVSAEGQEWFVLRATDVWVTPDGAGWWRLYVGTPDGKLVGRIDRPEVEMSTNPGPFDAEGGRR